MSIKYALPLLLLATCAAHASEDTPQQFIFGSYATYLDNPAFKVDYGSGSTDTLYGHTANQYTIGSGVILQQHHRVKFGYTFGDFKIRGEDQHSNYEHTNTLFTQYDYILPLNKNINLLAGATAGYQFASHKDEKVMFNGPVVGAQVGVEYRYQQFGFEVGYHYNVHLKDHKYDEDGNKLTQNDDQTLAMGVNYYF
ncbi:hypothetical protein SKA34_13310 [Photobacterium sp. SKA34]|uniref:outer membrane beta-barrel protein n=1 Tax=Photobacterium sp. SKA34 TaxID=121723 RepID=UPI00006ABE18|nr:outer membrane beta-barrel protein [Photobacterium sp. SKA34]EAR55441.1 hypothetical protein SKA34_13310 [Photobacterium sp. SKA34]